MSEVRFIRRPARRPQRLDHSGLAVLPPAPDGRRQSERSDSIDSTDTVVLAMSEILRDRPACRHHDRPSNMAQRSKPPPDKDSDRSSDGSDASGGAGSGDDGGDDRGDDTGNDTGNDSEDESGNDSGNDSVNMLPRMVDIVLDPTGRDNLKNVTIELEMDVREDLEEPIEEFCRLWRLGRFKDAGQYFKTNLAKNIHKESVRIPYGEMLLARGDYKAFTKMKDKEWLNYECGDQRQHPNDRPCPSLLLLWRFHSLARVLDNGDNCLLGSEEKLLTDIHAIPDDFNENPQSPMPEWAGWIDERLQAYYRELAQGVTFNLPTFRDYFTRIPWRELYGRILSTGNIWELRDTILLMTHVFPDAKDISACLFGTINIDVMFSKLLDDWRLDCYDEGTELALLDITSTLLLKIHRGKSCQSDRLVDGCLEATKQLASHIMQNDPESMHSRPFLRYALSQVSFQIYEAQHKSQTSPEVSKGIILHQKDPEFQLPVYVPEADGLIPSPDPRRFKNVPTDRLTVILNAARELGDYRLEADCLKHLALAADEPKQYLDDLVHLQRDVQHDEEGHLRTLLASFSLLPVTPESWEQVLGSILLFDRLPGHSGPESISPNLLWAKAMITSLQKDTRRLGGSWKAETRRLAPSLHTSVRIFVQKKFGLDLCSNSTPAAAASKAEEMEKELALQRKCIRVLKNRVGKTFDIVKTMSKENKQSVKEQVRETKEWPPKRSHAPIGFPRKPMKGTKDENSESPDAFEIRFRHVSKREKTTKAPQDLYFSSGEDKLETKTEGYDDAEETRESENKQSIYRRKWLASEDGDDVYVEYPSTSHRRANYHGPTVEDGSE